MVTAINFDGEQVDENRPLGIDIATREFIRAFFRYGAQNKFPCVCPDEKALNQFKSYAKMEKINPDICFGVNQNDPIRLEEAGHLFRYDPGIIKHIWSRRQFGQRRYSISGLLHTSSTDSVMEIIGQYLMAPTQSWDALICPSKSIRSAALNIIEHWQYYLKDRTDSDFKCPVQFPVIPLGVDTQHFNTITLEKQRIEQRKTLALEKEEVAILFTGRLNHIAKANPLPLMLGVEQASVNSKTPIRLVFFGYFNDEFNELAFKEAAAKVCNIARVTFIRHGDRDYPNGFWAGADIFCSLADNIQESFGLTPIEAMASGLPVIVSDWNGYRDTVRDGVDGYTVPTLVPGKGLGNDLAYKYFSGQNNYGDHLGAIQQSTSIDFETLISVLKKLIENPELRFKMGAAGKERAHSKYDWTNIISAYEEFWLELSNRRSMDREINPLAIGSPFHPSRPDPFDMFSSFPSRQLSEKGKVKLVNSNRSEVLKLISLKVGYVYPDSLIELEELPILFDNLEGGSYISIESLKNRLPSYNPTNLILTLAWLVKLGICRYCP
ncbi:MAG: glycosyltransferase family 4 protein [Pseudomonadota bacterium]|nr:glycosyltransferase family 4 protein [Pseudomonadota bacterium]